MDSVVAQARALSVQIRFSRPPADQTLVRNPSLDILRAVAILLVFCYHSEGAVVISRFGWTGVDLFFVLSGFLVSGLLFREYQKTGAVRPGRFLIRRGLKIYPQFYVFLAITVVVISLTEGPPSAGAILASAAFVQNYFPCVWSHTWSLAVEEHFYLLLTLGLTWLARRGGANPFRTLPVWIACVCGLILALRILTWNAWPITSKGNVYPSHLRVDSLLAGVLVAYGHAFHADVVARWVRRWANVTGPVSILLLALALPFSREDPFMVTIGFSLTACGFALLLLSVLYPVKPSEPGRMGKALASLGQVSYGFYLWHAPVLVLSDTFLTAWAPVVRIPPTFAVSLALAILTTRWIEAPGLALRDRLWPASGDRPREPRRSTGIPAPHCAPDSPA